MDRQESLKLSMWLPTETDDQALDWLFKNVIYAPISMEIWLEVIS